MTVSSSTNKVSFNGDDSTTVFAYSFKVFDQDDLTVIVRDSDGVETTKTITTDYTVSGVGNAGGGNVTMVTAPATGETLTILREQDLLQGLDLVPNDPFPAQSLEDALDKVVFMVQQHDEELARAIKASKTNTIGSTEFTVSASDRASKVFAFDSSGELAVTQELGTFRGNWAASTAFFERDLVKDSSNSNIYICLTAHTSSGTIPISSNADSAKWGLIVDAAAAATSASNAATSATEAETSATNAATSASAAATSEGNASTSATTASTQATAAAGSATAAAASATAAAGSESAAATSESNASTSETNAATSATNAATSATNAATSESNASTSESNASTSATTATTQATNAATSATNAATSESNAATSESNASTSETNAANSATAAAASQTAAETAKTNAETAESNASSSATAAASSATAAASSATAAAGSATAASASETAAETAESNASTSETNAATSATNAATSATNAATSETNAATSATAAASSATSAQASKDAALAALDNFDDRYLGQKASDPTLDNDGDALIAGALYFNTTDDVMKVYEGSVWVAAYASLSGALLVSNNLSDLASASSGRTNLGLGTGDSPTFAGLTTTADVTFGDNDKAIFGAGSDLQIYHDGSNSYVRDVGTGVFLIQGDSDIWLQNSSGTASYARFTNGGASTIYYDNAAKLATTSTGISVTGNATFADNGKAIFGAGSDLQIYHDGSHSYVKDNGTGDLKLQGNNLYLQNASGETYLGATSDGLVFLRYDNATKLATTSTGIDVTGTVTATSFSGNGSALTGIEAFESGTLMLFQQTSAPTGWTKSTTHNDKALRVVSGTAGSGGSAAFTTALGTPSVSGSLSGSVGATTLSISQIPSHNHSAIRLSGSGSTNMPGYSSGSSTTAALSEGGSGSHNHSFSGSLSSATAAINVNYVDVIIASKD